MQLCELETRSILSPKNLNCDRVFKIEWLITDVIAFGSPVRAESETFGLFWCFGQVSHFFDLGGGQIVISEPPHELKNPLMII